MQFAWTALIARGARCRYTFAGAAVGKSKVIELAFVKAALQAVACADPGEVEAAAKIRGTGVRRPELLFNLARGGSTPQAMGLRTRF